MGEGIPEDDFFAKFLVKDAQNRVPSSRKKKGDLHLSYLREVILLCNPHGLHHDEVSSHVLSGSDIRESTGGGYLVRNLDIFCYHRFWQSPMGSSKPPQCGKESIFLDRHELGEIAITTVEFMVSKTKASKPSWLMLSPMLRNKLFFFCGLK